MKIIETPLKDCRVIEPRVFNDERGWFFETFNSDEYSAAGLVTELKQFNVSWSRRSTLRGLHFQHTNPQGKLVTVLDGEIWDVAVDIRKGSPQFGEFFAVNLSSGNRRQLWVPPGFAHGFVVLSEFALVSYGCTETYQPGFEMSLAWDDPALGINWPIRDVILSSKDRDAMRLTDIPVQHLLSYDPE